MANELKPWRYDIQPGPEGEYSYTWVYDDHGVMVGTMKTHKAKEIVERMNTRPAAPVEGLETVETQMRCLLQTGNHQWRNPRVPSELSFIKANGKDEAGIPYELRELVTRSQAEAIIAAERSRADKAEADAEKYREYAAEKSNQVSTLQKDNAALNARVKELTGDRDSWRRVAEKLAGEKQALETQLAAARKALEPFANAAEMALISGNPPGNHVDANYFLEARAALEDRP